MSVGIGAPRAGGMVLDTPGDCWFTEFYQASFDAAYRYASLLCRDSALAEDVVSDAFLRAWMNQGALINGSSPMGWILTVIRHRVADEFRSRRTTVDIEQISERVDTEFSSESELTSEDLEVIRRAIGHLTEEQQQVIFLRFFEQLSHEDVARQLARNANAIRAVQFRALARLRTLLEAERAR